MATEPTYEFPLQTNSYAAFDAISLRNLIIQRLNDQGILTDQNYIGSNIASIIDIISFSFNTLIYYLNKTSTESMFTEAQLYENISRIVKLLDYKPIGYQTSTLSFQCTAVAGIFESRAYTIPRYSYITVGGIPFSFNEDITFTVPYSNRVIALDDISNRKLLFQGMFREAPLYTAAGDASEVVTIAVSNVLIDHFNIDVYVYEKKTSTWVQYKNVPNFYSEQSYSRTFEKKINSNFLYEIVFGDGINGRKLEAGDIVSVYFLQSSGEQGIIGPGALRLNSVPILYYNRTYANILNDVIPETQQNSVTPSQFRNIIFNNVVGSTTPKDIEDADSIRRNAPYVFKSQYRLVTQSDYESYIKTNFAHFITDVKVFTNWDYTGKYLKYFHDINVNPGGFKQVLFNQIQYADSCNFNNIYVCAVPKVSKGSSLKYLLPAQKETIASNMQSVKMLTTEVSFMDPIFKAISFGIKNGDAINIDAVDYFQLQLFKTINSNRSPNSIKQEAAAVIREFFNPTKMTLGIVFDYSALTNQLLSINGVDQLRTSRSDTEEYFNGLSFFMWNPSYPDLDKQTIVNNITLKEFELLYFNNLSTIDSRITVVEQ